MATGSVVLSVVGVVWMVFVVLAAVLVIWIALLLVQFLRLKNAELRQRADRFGGPDANGS